jgi:hypothetical protein
MHPTSRLISCALLAVAMPALCSAAIDAPALAPMEQALILRVDGQLIIDASGVPTSYQIKTALPQNLRDSLQRHVRSWHFEPVLVGGKPVVAQTQMRVTLAAQGAGNDYRVEVDNVTFPQTSGRTPDASNDPDNPVAISMSRKNTITYPSAALENDINADALVVLRLTPEGRVAQAFVTQVALLNIKGRTEDLQTAAGIFERQVLADVKDWRFRVDVEQAKLAALQSAEPDAIASAFTVQVPIGFRMDGSTLDNRAGWLSEARTPLRRAPWLRAESAGPSIGASDLASGELAPAASRFHLAASVAGTTL